MDNNWALLLTGACIFANLSAQAAESGVAVSLPNGPVIEVKPREVATAAFRVTNNGGEKRQLGGRVILPGGWRALTEEVPFEIGPGETDIRLLSFFVPLESPPANYEVAYSATDAAAGLVLDTGVVTAVVLPFARLDTKLLRAPDYVVAGEDYRASFLVVNHGNCASSITVKVQSSDSFPAEAVPETLELEPKQSREITVTVKTHPDLRRELTHRLELKVTGLEGDTEKVLASAKSSVEVVPQVAGIEDPFHRLPARVVFRGISESGARREHSFQGDFLGSGTLDDEGKKRIDFLFRGPDTEEWSTFSERDEYRVSYQTDNYQVRLGDQVYSLSPLTEWYRYGCGADVQFNTDRFTVGGYRQETRWFEPREEQSAGHLSYRMGDKYEVGVNYLKKSADAWVSRGGSGDIVSLEGLFRPSDRIGVEAEYAVGNDDAQQGSGDDDAYRLKVDGHEKWISYQLETVHAQPDCPGYYRDLDFKAARVSIPIWDSLRLNAHFRDQQQNLDRNPTFHSALHSQHRQVGFSYRLGRDTNVFLDYRSRLLEDLLPEPEYDSREDTLGVALGQQFKRFSLWVSAEGGEKTDRLTDEGGASGSVQRYSLSALVNPTLNQSYRAYIQLDDDGLFGGNENRITGGLNASFRLGGSTLLSANYQRSQYTGLMDRTRDQFDVALGHTFANEHELMVRGRYAMYGDGEREDEAAVIVQYGIPFGLPVSRKTKMGVLEGRVYNVENSQRGLPRVIVRLNELTTVTDAKGNFTFGSLEPGRYYLMVDKAGVGLETVTVQKSPVEVNVRAGKRNRMDVPVTRGASVKGRVVVCGLAGEGPGNRTIARHARAVKSISGEEAAAREPENGAISGGADQSETVDLDALANVLVELSCSSETVRRFTDRKGRFLFEDVRPGVWTLRVVGGELPEHYRWEKEDFTFELRPGDEQEVLLRALPEGRRIQIIEAGNVIQEGE